MSESVNSPDRNGVYTDDAQKNNRFIHDVYQCIGVMAFIAYAFPAIFDMTCVPFQRITRDATGSHQREYAGSSAVRCNGRGCRRTPQMVCAIISEPKPSCCLPPRSHASKEIMGLTGWPVRPTG